MRIALLAGLLCASLGSVRAGEPTGPQVPIALAWDGEETLLVALRDGRQVARIDVKTGRVVNRRAVPFQPASMTVGGGPGTFIVGGMDGEVAVLGQPAVRILRRATGRGSTRVVSIDLSRIAVVSTWDELVWIIETEAGAVVRSIRLGFSPGVILRKPDGRLLVADSFGGKIADVDPETGRVRRRSMDGVGLKGMAVTPDGKEVLIGHMAQYGPVPITGNNIDWGLVLSSRLSAVRLAEFDREDSEGERLGRRQLTLDGPAHGASDPSAIAITPDGRFVLIALSGAHQVIKNDRLLAQSAGGAPDLLPLGNYQRIEIANVGRSPFDIAIDPSGTFAATADAMSDTVSILEVETVRVQKTIHTGEVVARTPAQRGEAHFLDGRLSHDRWMSCGSCHPGGHTNGLNFDTLTDGVFGAAKNTPSLLAVKNTPPYGWTGGLPTLEGQIHQSLGSTLRGPAAEAGVASDIAAYLVTQRPPPPRRDPQDPAAFRGARVFEDRRCASCHAPPRYTVASLKYVALDDGPGGHKEFNPPSLRGVGWSAPYFHDGRAATLDDVLKVHPPSVLTPLPPSDRADLAAFLESL
jgi:mono/diheme cytochrome c family protein/cytochrome c553